jgi:hypothetical protein
MPAYPQLLPCLKTSAKAIDLCVADHGKSPSEKTRHVPPTSARCVEFHRFIVAFCILVGVDLLTMSLAVCATAGPAEPAIRLTQCRDRNAYRVASPLFFFDSLSRGERCML